MVVAVERTCRVASRARLALAYHMHAVYAAARAESNKIVSRGCPYPQIKVPFWMAPIRTFGLESSLEMTHTRGKKL